MGIKGQGTSSSQETLGAFVDLTLTLTLTQDTR